MRETGLWLAWGVAAAVVAAALTRRLVIWALARGVVDVPNARSSHGRVVPRGGGISLVIVVAAVSALVALVADGDRSRIVGAVLPALMVAAVSWIDDVRSLPVRTRLAVHLLAAIAATWALGPVRRVDVVGSVAFETGAVAWPLTLAWIVGLTNAFNFMDGSDGIAGVTAAAVGAGVAAAAVGCADGPVALVSSAFAGACIGFLTCNWQPARIFMGDVGSTFCGFMLAVLPLAVRPECVGEMLPVAFVPLWPFIFDTSYTLSRRLLSGEHITRAHRSHLYQRLLRAGWSHRGVAWLYGGLAAFGSAVSAAPGLDHDVARAAGPIAAAWLPIGAVLLVTLVAFAERRVPARRRVAGGGG